MNPNDLIGVVLLAWFVALGVAETLFGREQSYVERSSDGRLVTNFTLMGIVVLASMIMPLFIAGAAAASQRLNFGIAPRLGLPWVASFVLALLAVTFTSYWAHRVMHLMPLWRIHRVHHVDPVVDVSTSFRNHPFEMLVTVPMAAIAYLVVGPPLTVVVTTQTVLVAATIFQHADVPVPAKLDRALSLVVFTPRLHRLHHNPERMVHDTNFGELIVLWDWLFGTLNLTPPRGRVGLDKPAARPDHLLDQMLWPFHRA